MQKRTAVLLAVLLAGPVLAGCLGGESRSEWALTMTQLNAVDGDGAGVVVAVLDTGINVGHASMDHLVDGKNGNGELVAFKDYVGGRDGVSNAYDDDGHGTHVSGIMVARGSSFSDKLVYGGVDLRGGSPAIQLVVARVCDGDGCRGESLDDAVRWATAQGAQVISLSLGGEPGGLDLPVRLQSDLERAINDSIGQGVVVVAAAGNQGTDANDVSTPADIPRVIAVGAANRDGRVAQLSSRGDASDNQCRTGGLLDDGATGRCPPNQKPEVIAPGVDILSAWAGDNYVKASGTSQATPFVSSVVALMLEGQPRLQSSSDVVQIKQVLMDTAKKVPGQDSPHDDGAGYGIVQAQRALRAYSDS